MRALVHWLAVMALLLLSSQALGQVRHDVEIDEPPKVMKPVDPPKARKNHFEALKLYAHAKQMESESRLDDAFEVYEKIIRLDPGATPVYKSLITLCLSLNKDEQAFDYCRQAVRLEPPDYEILCLYGREMQERGKLDEAAEALAKAVELPEAKDNPQQVAEIWFRLAGMFEELSQFTKAGDAYEQVTALLGQFDTADSLFSTARQSNVQMVLARTYERLGKARLEAQEYDRAVAAFRAAQDKDPSHADRLYYNLAEVYAAKGDHAKAQDLITNYIKTRPTGDEAYVMLVSILKASGKNGQLVAELERYSAKDPFNQSLKLLLAQQYVEAGQVDKAEPIFLAGFKRDDSETAYKGLAELYKSQGRWEELLAFLDDAVEDRRNLASARPQLAVIASDATLVKGIAKAALAQRFTSETPSFNTRRVLATFARETQEYEAAEQLCRWCLPEDPNPGDVYVELIRTLGAAKKYDAQAAVCQQAIGKQLQVPDIIFRLELARAYSLSGKNDEALAAAQDAVRRTDEGSEDRFRAQYLLATVYFRSNQLDAAVAECESLLPNAVEPREERQVRYLLSGIYSTQHNYAKSEEQLLILLDMDPDDAGVNNDLGYIWADQGKNLEEAERMIRKALELDRKERMQPVSLRKGPQKETHDKAAYVDSLGWVLFKRGKFEEAAKQLERATRLPNGDDPVLWDHLGDAYQALKQYDKARGAFYKALELYKTSERVGLEDRQGELKGKLKLLEREVARGDQ